ncbi:MAG: hypothetical protein IPL12_11685 [Bacteroidetes bacterium]|nr:hypothetical protein [Bacteroidota bacterium]
MNKIVIALLICLPFTAYSQKYVTAGGIRMSKEGIGLSLQQKVFDHTTVEGIVLFNLNETSVGGLLEYHNNLLFTKSLNTYIGAGPVYGKFYNADSSYWGANVVFGLEQSAAFAICCFGRFKTNSKTGPGRLVQYWYGHYLSICFN